jgi:hypothetical protein
LSPFFRSSTLEWNDICGCLPCTGLSCGPPGHADSEFLAVSDTHTPPDDELAAAGAGFSAAAGLSAGGGAALAVPATKRAATVIQIERTQLFITTSRTST